MRQLLTSSSFKVSKNIQLQKFILSQKRDRYLKYVAFHNIPEIVAKLGGSSNAASERTRAITALIYSDCYDPTGI